MANEINQDWMRRLVDALEAEFSASGKMFDAYMASVKNAGLGAWLSGATQTNAAEIIRLSGEQTKAQRDIIAILSELHVTPAKAEPQDELKGLFLTGGLNEG